MIAPGDQRGPRRRTQRCRMELRVTQSRLGYTIKRRRRDYAAEGAGDSVALIVGHDEKNVGRALGRYHARRPVRRGILGVFLDHASERHRRRRKLLTVKHLGGIRRTRRADDLLRRNRGRSQQSKTDRHSGCGQNQGYFLTSNIHRAIPSLKRLVLTRQLVAWIGWWRRVGHLAAIVIRLIAGWRRRRRIIPIWIIFDDSRCGSLSLRIRCHQRPHCHTANST